MKPGQKTLDTIGGAHKLQSWPHNILTGEFGACLTGLLISALADMGCTQTVEGTLFGLPASLFSVCNSNLQAKTQLPDGLPTGTRASHRRRCPLPEPARQNAHVRSNPPNHHYPPTLPNPTKPPIPRLLTPEHSISLQNSIGSDIIMQLDDVIATTSPDTARITEATHRSIRWLDRCIAAHANPSTQNLFCIIQGGLDLDLRRECTLAMLERDTPGIAIGGLSGGEAKEEYCKVVKTCTELLPEGKPRYVMGVGFPDDLVVSVALGADMFDCVWPTRTARFGNAVTSRGLLNLRQQTYAGDFGPVEEGCQCVCCRPVEESGLGITRAFIYHTAAKETAGAHLLSIHNVFFLLDLMRRAREAILADEYPAFLKGYFDKMYAGQKDKYPAWAVEALLGVGVDLKGR